MIHCGFLIQVSPTLKPCRKSEREGLEEEGYSEGLQEDIHIIVQNRSVIFIFFFFIIHRLGREWERRVGGVITLFLVCGRSFVREKSLSHFSSGKSLFCKFASAGMPSHTLPRAKGYKFHEATVSNSDSYHSLHTPHRDGPPHTPRPFSGQTVTNSAANRGNCHSDGSYSLHTASTLRRLLFSPHGLHTPMGLHLAMIHMHPHTHLPPHMPDLRDFAFFFSLAGKTAVVTGGSRRLGLHAATG